jgi:hypothetical protein
MTTPDTPSLPKSRPTTADHKDVLLVLLKELGDALRSRSEPEHLYTAAAVGGFGAVAWGVAALQPDKYLSRPFYLRPAWLAAVGIFIVAAFIVKKIRREHGIYAEAKKEQARIGAILSSLEGATGIIPEYMLKEVAGPGYKGSQRIVITAAAVAACFCLSLAWF